MRFVSVSTVHRISGEELALLTRAGHVSERAELLDGVIHEHMTPSPDHYILVVLITQAIRDALTSGWVVLEEKPLELSKHSYPEPDVMVLTSMPLKGYPSPADVVLVVEVADSSLTHYLGAKADLYRSAGIGSYLVVDLKLREVVQPDGFGQAPQELVDAIDRVLTNPA